MLGLISFLVVSLCFIFMIYKFNKRQLQHNYRILNPINIYLAVWMITLLTHSFVYIDNSYRKNLYNIYYIFWIGTISFCIGFWLLQSKMVSFGHLSYYEYNNKNLIVLLKIFTTINILRVIYMFGVVYRLAGNLTVFFSMNTYVRQLYLNRATNIATYLIELPLSVLSMLGYSILGIVVGRKLKGYRSKVIIWCVLEFAMSVITMSKLNLIIFIVVLGISIINNVGKVYIQKKVIKKYMPAIILLIFALLLVISIQRNYSYYGNSADIVKSKLLYYIASPLEAFGVSIETNSICNVVDVVDVGDGATNVFTWFRYFYNRLGILGIVVYPFFIGILAGMVYDTKRNNLLLETANDWIGCLVFMSYYSYLWSHRSYMLVIFAAIVLHLFYKKKLYKIVAT